MIDNFYKDIFNILELIKEINKLSNGKYNEKIHGQKAPAMYIFGKCYYFARILNEVLTDGKLYIALDPLHVMLKVDNYYYDALGYLCECDCKNYFPIDPKVPQDIDLINATVANEYDDKYLLPVLLQIAKEADENVKKKNSVVPKIMKKEIQR